MPANLGPVAEAPPQWSPRLSCLQPVPKGSWRYPCGVATPIAPDPVLLSGLLLSVCHTQLQLPGGQQERAVGGGLSPTQPALAVALPKQALCSLP